LDKLGALLAERQRAGTRVILRFDEANTKTVLEAVLASNGRLTQLTPARFTLEELFVQALSEAGPRGTVGGDIS
ncbi:MAG: ABC transporter ATP-binding protein, partial [Myxococcaceae bacterium]|nr:ABC transporter ATP-binding protein [Myxococcaceae bacterium]